MDKNDSQQNIKNKWKRIFTKKHFIQASAGLLFCGVLAAGGGWYHHQQEQAEHAQFLAAHTNMMEAQANKNNVALLDSATIRSLTAEAIGLDENTITFREITLLDIGQQGIAHEEEREHRDKKNAKKHSTKKQELPPTANDYTAVTAEQPAAPAPAFQPIYKVSCKANHVKYKLHLDAVNGTVLRCSMEED